MAVVIWERSQLLWKDTVPGTCIKYNFLLSDIEDALGQTTIWDSENIYGSDHLGKKPIALQEFCTK